MLEYVIQYDRGDESDRVFSSIVEGENAKHAIMVFEEIFKDYRILSVELVPKRLVDVDKWEKLIEFERQARNRVIDGLE